MGVTGIGGIFLRSNDPARLQNWYIEHLGVGAGKFGKWEEQAGPSVFAPCSRNADHFPLDRAVMLNFRVDDLPAMIARLRGAEVEVETRPEWTETTIGSFARLTDCDGNRIELWEPATDRSRA